MFITLPFTVIIIITVSLNFVIVIGVAAVVIFLFIFIKSLPLSLSSLLIITISAHVSFPHYQISNKSIFTISYLLLLIYAYSLMVIVDITMLTMNNQSSVVITGENFVITINDYTAAKMGMNSNKLMTSCNNFKVI